jgi:hypothetical protein
VAARRSERAPGHLYAYWHHPRFSSGEHGNAVALQPIWQALYDAGAEVALNGHDHNLTLHATCC